ncbi:MAG TPA: helix-turn-helix transcriptional regulator [Rhizomicrobium sp.]|jgi:transcriptional regulator with XRE-family HTH domain
MPRKPPKHYAGPSPGAKKSKHGKASSRPEHETDCAVGLRLRQLRTGRGLTQEQLAQKFGISMQQVQKYERGTNRISSSLLFQLARLFGVPINTFFDEAAHIATDTNDAASVDSRRLHEFARTAEGQSLLTAFRAVSRRNQRREIISLVRSLAGIGED